MKRYINGTLPPKNTPLHGKTSPQNTPLRGKTSYDAYVVKIGPPMQAVHVTKRPKKDKEKNFTMANWLFTQTTHIIGSRYCSYGVVGGLWAVVISFKFHENRLSGY